MRASLVAARALGWLSAATVAALSALSLTDISASSFRHRALALAGAAAFLLMMGLESRARFLRHGAVAVAAVGLLAGAVVAPPRESRDVWAYAAYGRMVSHHHVSPYRHAPEDFPDDPWEQNVDQIWRDSRSVYGPAFTLLSWGITAAAGQSHTAARVLFQTMAALAALAAMVVLARRRADAGALALIGLNPFVIVGVVNGGHNDAIVGLCVLAGALLAADRKPKAAGVVLAVATLIKVTAILPAAAIVVWVLARRGRSDAVRAGASFAALVAAGYAAAGGAAALAPLADAIGTVSLSLVSFGHALDVIRSGADSHVLVPAPEIMTILAIASALPLLAAHAREEHPMRAAGVAALGYALVAPYLLPWYAFWALPVLALAWRSVPGAVVLVHSAVLTIGYVMSLGAPPEGTAWPWFRWFLVALPVWEYAAFALLLAVAYRSAFRHAPAPAAGLTASRPAPVTREIPPTPSHAEAIETMPEKRDEVVPVSAAPRTKAAPHEKKASSPRKKTAPAPRKRTTSPGRQKTAAPRKRKIAAPPEKKTAAPRKKTPAPRKKTAASRKKTPAPRKKTAASRGSATKKSAK